MPTIGGVKIENLTALQAHQRGYLTLADTTTHVNWVLQNIEERSNKTLVYINGQYKGMATTRTKLSDIIFKFLTHTIE